MDVRHTPSSSALLLLTLCALPGGCASGGSEPPDALATPPAAAVQLWASPHYGETPLQTTLSWELDSDAPGRLTCELDFDGDGAPDEVLSPCTASGSRPWVYGERGEHRPRITVLDASGEPVADAELRVFSNEVILADEVVQLDALESFTGFDLEGDAVTLHLAAEEATALHPGAILLSRGGGGLLRRVVAVVEIREGTIRMDTRPAGLDEAIAEGFWGLLPAAAVTPEVLRGVRRSAGKVDLIGIDGALSTPVVQFSPAVPDVTATGGGGSLALTDVEVLGHAQAGIHAFILKKNLFSPMSFDISVWTAADWHLGATVVGGASKTWSYPLPEIPLGAVMVGPVPITFGLEPGLYGSVGVNGSLRVETDGAVYVMGGAHNLSGSVTPYGDIDFDSGLTIDPAEAEVSGTAKAGLSVRLKVQVASLLGPFAQAGGYGKAEVSVAPEEVCVDASLGLEGAVGGEIEFFQLIDVELSYPFGIAEWPLWSDCFELPCEPDCAAVECGPDPHCGAACGACADGWACDAGQCVAQELCGNGACDADEGYQSCPQDCLCEPACGEEVLVPAGGFTMGCDVALDGPCEGNEQPAHPVQLEDYYIDRTEVTQAAYAACVYAGVCEEPTCGWDPAATPDHPVVCVDWHAARAYCQWIGRRLPTEAEWEKAARGTDGRRFPWGDDDPTCDRAVMKDGGAGCGAGTTAPACSRSPLGDSPHGLCDMAGNAWEWVEDWYGGAYYEVAPLEGPPGPEAGTHRVIRGGSLYSAASTLRASCRERSLPTSGLSFIGFRCAR